MGNVTVRLAPAEVGAAHAASAAAWIEASHRGIRVTLTGTSATLWAETISRERLLLHWRVALLNERLLADGASRRASVMAGLVE